MDRGQVADVPGRGIVAQDAHRVEGLQPQLDEALGYCTHLALIDVGVITSWWYSV